MKIKQRYFTLILPATFALSGSVWAVTIESPRPGEQVMPGQTVWLIVQPSSGAEMDVRAVKILAPGASGCEDVLPMLPIQCALTIPDGSDKSSIPTGVDIRVMVTFANGTESSISANVNVSAAAAEAIMALRGDPREHPLVFDSVGQEKDLTVLGESADGATHNLKGRSQGTTYDIGNPAIVKVHDDGRVVAQSPGTTTITVRSGALFFEVPVIVRSAQSQTLGKRNNIPHKN